MTVPRAARAPAIRVAARPGEGLLSQVFHVISEGLCILDLARGRFVDINGSFEALLGWPRDDVLGRTARQLGLWDRPRDRISLVSRLLVDGSVQGFDTRLRDRHGRVLDVQIAARLIEINDEAFVLATVRDVSEHRQLEDGLRRTTARVLNILQEMPAAFFAVDADWRVTFVNPIAAGLMRKPAEEVIGRVLWDEFPESVGTAFHTAGTSVMSEGIPVDLEYYHAPFDSWFEVHAHPADGGVSVYVRDVTARKRVEEELRSSAARKAAILDSALDCVITIDAEGTILEFNPAAERTFGYRRQDAVGQPMAQLIVPPSLRDQHAKGMARYLDTGRGSILDRRIEMIAMRADGTMFPVELSVTRVDVPGPPTFSGHIRDITDRRRAEEEVAFLAFHDVLTGLPNRVRFEEVLNLALARADRADAALAVLYLDIDNFKLINDGLGHGAGDELLRQVASRLRTALRETDVLARQGGDEFMLLVGDLASAPGRGQPEPAEVASVVAERIHGALEAPFALEGTQVTVTSSIGIALFPSAGEDAETLLRNADAAMYQSKRTRRGGHVIFARNGSDPNGELSFSTRLRRAVEEREWTLHYQPMVSLADGEPVGVEALIRWQDPDGQLILPGVFIPLAEELGMIEAIGRWVRKEVCRQVSGWNAMGLATATSFNVSLRELQSMDLVDDLARCLEGSDIPSGTLVIEVTESAAMSEPERTRSMLGALHDLGARIAIDDFGTGYSSLSRLHELPVDILKIDRSFVRQLPHDHHAASIVTAIISLATSLGMEPLAEGIETEAQRAFLVEHGCRQGQGFLFARPMAAPEVTALLQAGRTGSLPA